MVKVIYYLVRRYEGTKYLSLFNPNVGKYGPEKTPYLDTLHAMISVGKVLNFFHLIDLMLFSNKVISFDTISNFDWSQ